MRAVLRAGSAMVSVAARLPLSLLVVLAGLVVAGAALGGGSGPAGQTPTTTAPAPAAASADGVAVESVVVPVAFGGTGPVPAVSWGGGNDSGDGGCSGPSCGQRQPAVWGSGGGMPGHQPGGSSSGADFDQGAPRASGGGPVQWLSKMFGLQTGAPGGEREYRTAGRDDDGRQWAGGSGRAGAEHWPGAGHESKPKRGEPDPELNGRGQPKPGQSKPGQPKPGKPGPGPGGLDPGAGGDGPGSDLNLRGFKPTPDAGGGEAPQLNGSGGGLLAWIGGLVSRILGAVAGVIDQAVAELQSGQAGQAGGQAAAQAVQPTGQTGGQPTGQTGGQPTGQTGGQPTGQTGGQPTGQTGGQPTGQTGGQPTGQPGGQMTGQTGGQMAGPAGGQTAGPAGDRTTSGPGGQAAGTGDEPSAANGEDAGRRTRPAGMSWPTQSGDAGADAQDRLAGRGVDRWADQAGAGGYDRRLEPGGVARLMSGGLDLISNMVTAIGGQRAGERVRDTLAGVPRLVEQAIRAADATHAGQNGGDGVGGAPARGEGSSVGSAGSGPSGGAGSPVSGTPEGYQDHEPRALGHRGDGTRPPGASDPRWSDLGARGPPRSPIDPTSTRITQRSPGAAAQQGRTHPAPVKSAGASTPKPVPALSRPAKAALNKVDRLTGEQRRNARTIVATGQRLGIPERGQRIAVATALQESGLRNLRHGDRDSQGLFQQRPSQGWGSIAQVTDPRHAATSFYKSLRKVDGWKTMALTRAAQAVQRSAFPGAYAKWAGLADRVTKALNPTKPSTTKPSTPKPSTTKPAGKPSAKPATPANPATPTGREATGQDRGPGSDRTDTTARDRAGERPDGAADGRARRVATEGLAGSRPEVPTRAGAHAVDTLLTGVVRLIGGVAGAVAGERVEQQVNLALSGVPGLVSSALDFAAAARARAAGDRVAGARASGDPAPGDRAEYPAPGQQPRPAPGDPSTMTGGGQVGPGGGGGPAGMSAAPPSARPGCGLGGGCRPAAGVSGSERSPVGARGPPAQTGSGNDQLSYGNGYTYYDDSPARTDDVLNGRIEIASGEQKLEAERKALDAATQKAKGATSGKAAEDAKAAQAAYDKHVQAHQALVDKVDAQGAQLSPWRSAHIDYVIAGQQRLGPEQKALDAERTRLDTAWATQRTNLEQGTLDVSGLVDTAIDTQAYRLDQAAYQADRAGVYRATDALREATGRPAPLSGARPDGGAGAACGSSGVFTACAAATDTGETDTCQGLTGISGCQVAVGPAENPGDRGPGDQTAATPGGDRRAAFGLDPGTGSGIGSASGECPIEGPCTTTAAHSGNTATNRCQAGDCQALALADSGRAVSECAAAGGCTGETHSAGTNQPADTNPANPTGGNPADDSGSGPGDGARNVRADSSCEVGGGRCTSWTTADPDYQGGPVGAARAGGEVDCAANPDCAGRASTRTSSAANTASGTDTGRDTEGRSDCVIAGGRCQTDTGSRADNPTHTTPAYITPNGFDPAVISAGPAWDGFSVVPARVVDGDSEATTTANATVDCAGRLDCSGNAATWTRSGGDGAGPAAADPSGKSTPTPQSTRQPTRETSGHSSCAASATDCHSGSSSRFTDQTGTDQGGTDQTGAGELTGYPAETGKRELVADSQAGAQVAGCPVTGCAGGASSGTSGGATGDVARRDSTGDATCRLSGAGDGCDTKAGTVVSDRVPQPTTGPGAEAGDGAGAGDAEGAATPVSLSFADANGACPAGGQACATRTESATTGLDSGVSPRRQGSNTTSECTVNGYGCVSQTSSGASSAAEFVVQDAVTEKPLAHQPTAGATSNSQHHTALYCAPECEAGRAGQIATPSTVETLEQRMSRTHTTGLAPDVRVRVLNGDPLLDTAGTGYTGADYRTGAPAPRVIASPATGDPAGGSVPSDPTTGGSTTAGAGSGTGTGNGGPGAASPAVHPSLSGGCRGGVTGCAAGAVPSYDGLPISARGPPAWTASDDSTTTRTIAEPTPPTPGPATGTDTTGTDTPGRPATSASSPIRPRPASCAGCTGSTSEQFNTGVGNVGDGNSGDYNVGYRNTGDHNIGSRNSGSYNVGDANSGSYNGGISNSGDYNVGSGNSGSYNSGDRNTGSYNRGDRNTGSYNAGDANGGSYNRGDHNAGDYNVGYRNTGSYNSGDRNSGSYNTGDANGGSYNRGNRNAGDYNSGDRNTGSYNLGDRNSGDYNAGDANSGSYNRGNGNAGWYNAGDANSGSYNRGNHNSGSYNLGDANSGNHNVGSYNSGSYNRGDSNSGWYNVGDANSGSHNVGSYNSGSYNRGDSNSGWYNVGDANSGSHNVGSYNSGSYNRGNSNSGWYNVGDANSGSHNVGSYNSGSYNRGNSNSGWYNVGDANSGSHNVGSYNSGSYNRGDSNSGWYNLGSGNSGSHNTGDGNSGSYNVGDANSGDHNEGSRNSGSYNRGSGNSGWYNDGSGNSGSWNTGNDNSGWYNRGNSNSGWHNQGDHNSGWSNHGDHNAGWYNDGDHNRGDWNTGNRNSGSHNVGSGNAGWHNQGDHNTGWYNKGNHNAGWYNDGDRNTGDHNTGDWNHGNRNRGSYNTGDDNLGDGNSGGWNDGNYNRGDRNKGDWNSGDRNTGDWNSGSDNIGNHNLGDRNRGDRNSGSDNVGNDNSGDWNEGNNNSGNGNDGDNHSGDNAGHFCVLCSGYGNDGFLIGGNRSDGALISGNRSNGALIAGNNSNGALIAGNNSNGALIAGNRNNGLGIAGNDNNGALIAGNRNNGLGIAGVDNNGALIAGARNNGLGLAGVDNNGALNAGARNNGLGLAGVDNNGALNAGARNNGLGLAGVDNNGALNAGARNNGLGLAGVDNNGALIAGARNNGLGIAGTDNNGALIAGARNNGLGIGGTDNNGALIGGFRNNGLGIAGTDNNGALIIGGHNNGGLIIGGHNNGGLIIGGHNNGGLIIGGHNNGGLIIGGHNNGGLIIGGNNNGLLIVGGDNDGALIGGGHNTGVGIWGNDNTGTWIYGNDHKGPIPTGYYGVAGSFYRIIGGGGGAGVYFDKQGQVHLVLSGEVGLGAGWQLDATSVQPKEGLYLQGQLRANGGPGGVDINALVPLIGDHAGEPTLKATAKALGINVADLSYDASKPEGQRWKYTGLNKVSLKDFYNYLKKYNKGENPFAPQNPFGREVDENGKKGKPGKGLEGKIDVTGTIDIPLGN